MHFWRNRSKKSQNLTSERFFVHSFACRDETRTPIGRGALYIHIFSSAHLIFAYCVEFQFSNNRLEKRTMQNIPQKSLVFVNKKVSINRYLYKNKRVNRGFCLCHIRHWKHFCRQKTFLSWRAQRDGHGHF